MEVDSSSTQRILRTACYTRPPAMRAFSQRRVLLSLLLVAAAAGCGSGSSTSSGGSASGTPVNGGTLLAGIPSNPDHLDGALSATTEGW